MPDAHVGYGLPIGGVLALENAVIPYAVGVDIACRMKLSVLDLPPASLDDNFNRFKEAIDGGIRFGIGSTHEKPQDHPVMDQDWSITRITREKKDLAWSQLGTSGSGNHFVDVGVLSLPERDEDLGLDAGQYVAVMSHSGSRGPGAAVCHTYSGIARAQLPAKYEDLAYLSWLSLDSEAGQEYWAVSVHACAQMHFSCHECRRERSDERPQPELPPLPPPGNQKPFSLLAGPGNKTRVSCVFSLTEVQVFVNLLPIESSSSSESRLTQMTRPPAGR
jgi:RNA-splicing ligase RtcB